MAQNDRALPLAQVWRELVDRDILKRLDKAVRNLRARADEADRRDRAAGRYEPGGIRDEYVSRLENPPLFERWVTNHGRGVDPLAKGMVARGILAAYRLVHESLAAKMREGDFVARGRYGSDIASPREIPSHDWAGLRLHDLERSIIADHNGALIFDVVIRKCGSDQRSRALTPNAVRRVRNTGPATQAKQHVSTMRRERYVSAWKTCASSPSWASLKAKDRHTTVMKQLNLPIGEEGYSYRNARDWIKGL